MEELKREIINVLQNQHIGISRPFARDALRPSEYEDWARLS